MARNRLRFVVLAVVFTTPALARCDDETAQALVQLLRQGNVRQQLQALAGLEALGPKAVSAIPDIAMACGLSRNTRLKATCVEVLGATKSVDAVPDIRWIMAHEKNLRIQDAGKKALRMIGPPSQDEELWIRERYNYAVVDSKLVPLRLTNQGYDSSRGQSADDVRKEFQNTPPQWYFDESFFERRASMIPAIELNAHGTVDRFNVLQVLGKDDMLIHNISYDVKEVDRTKIVRLVGVSTTGLVDGQAVDRKLWIGIIGTWRYTAASGAANTVLLAVTHDRTRVNRTEFLKALEQHPPGGK